MLTSDQTTVAPPNAPHTTVQPASLLTDALAGLTAPRKTLPSKYFYDAEGSRLFEAICTVPEYHVTRVETAQLRAIVSDLATYIPNGAALVEFGSGASAKTRLLLDALPRLGCYIPIDISQDALDWAVAALSGDYPGLTLAPLAGDFTAGLRLPACADGHPIVGFFPGSTIGNFSPDEAEAFLLMARRLLGPGASLILGADHTRAGSLLVPAYDDAQGITAAFNKNVLARLNRECGATFDLAAFDHRAVWNAIEGRVEMHLASRTNQSVTLAGRRIAFTPGETIHTENSYKYHPERLDVIAMRAGWEVTERWVERHVAPNAEEWIFGTTLLNA
jgi:dimethylhistidine N-methyltransferase